MGLVWSGKKKPSVWQLIIIKKVNKGLINVWFIKKLLEDGEVGKVGVLIYCVGIGYPDLVLMAEAKRSQK